MWTVAWCSRTPVTKWKRSPGDWKSCTTSPAIGGVREAIPHHQSGDVASEPSGVFSLLTFQQPESCAQHLAGVLVATGLDQPVLVLAQDHIPRRQCRW
jgi:hypothetical protein